MRRSSEPSVLANGGAVDRAPLPAANDAPDCFGLSLVCLVAAVCACFWSSDGDLGFHLATGRAVLASGEIPTHNLLSFGEPEHVWQLHQWLPAVLFELVHRAYGIAGVISLKMVVVTLTWAAVFCAARCAGASSASSTLSCLLGIAASSFRFEARPYLFTHLSLSLIVLACAVYLRGPRDATNRGAERALPDAGEMSLRSQRPGLPARAQTTGLRREWFALAAAGCIAALACQLHAGAIDGLIALGVVALGVAVEPVRARILGASAFPVSGMRRAVVVATAAVSGGVAGVLVLASYHPLGPRVLLFPFEMASDVYLAQHLVEFRRPWALPFVALAAYWVWLAVWAIASISRARGIHAAWLLLGLVFAVLSLRFARMAFAFSIVGGPALALACDHTRVGTARPRQTGLALSLLALCVVVYSLRGHTPGFGYESNVWPLAHFEFIRTHALKGNAFVSDAWAGPFLGKFYPERRVFFDNRLEAYSSRFMREVYQRMRYAEPGWEELLDRHAIEIVLMRYTTEGELRFQRGAPNLRHQLVRDPRFTLVRFDDLGELFVRTHGANAELAERFALRGIDPDRRRFTTDPRSAAEPLLRAVERGERSATLLGLAARASAERGDSERARILARAALEVAPEDEWTLDTATRLGATAPTHSDRSRAR